MVSSRPLRGGKMTITEVVINDGTAGLRLSWFNQPWVANRMKVGDAISVSGKVEQYLGRLVMNSPDWEPVEVENLHTNRIVPVYPLTANVTQQWMRRLMHQMVTIGPQLTDHLPETVRQAAGLPARGRPCSRRISPILTKNCRPPASAWPSTRSSSCRPASSSAATGSPSLADFSRLPKPGWKAVRHLPFALTDAQKSTLQDLRADLNPAAR